MALKDNLKAARKESGLSQAKLAEEAGVSQQLISQIENGDPSAGKEMLPQIAAALGRKVEDLDPEFWNDRPRVQATRIAAAVGIATTSRRPTGQLGALPVYASARGGEAELVLGNEPIDFARHPLENVVGAYTTYVVGESMWPLFSQGDLVLVNPHTPPRSGDDVILQTAETNDTGERMAMVKRIARVGGDELQLEQFNPPRKFKVRRRDWPTTHVIVGKYSRR